MHHPKPDPLPPERAAIQQSHLHDKGTDSLRKAIARAPSVEPPPPVPELPAAAPEPAKGPMHPAERAWAHRPGARR